jgi:ribose transport system substrate-binding protein
LTPSVRGFVGRLGAVAILGALVAPASVAHADAGGNGHGSHFRFAWLANDPANTYDAATLAGIREVAAESKSTVDPMYDGFDLPTQLDQCRQAVASGIYEGLFITAADPVGIEPCVSNAQHHDVAVVAVDLPIGPDQTTVQPQVPGEVGASFIPASRFGEDIGGFVPQLCAGLNPCNLLYVAGDESFPFDQYGLAGVRAAAASHPSVRLIDHQQAFYDTATARQVVDQELAAHPEINAVIASGDQMALGAEQAASQRGVTLRILGAGAGASALQAVRSGRWVATFNALPKTEGRLGANMMLKALRDDNAKPTGLDPVLSAGLPRIWTPATLAQYPSFTGEWPGP